MKTKPQKQQRFEIDQSVRIEELNRDTIIGIANKQEGFAVILPRKTKRHFNEDFRRRGMAKRLGPTLFAGAVVASLRIVRRKPTSLVLDVEYPGYDGLIAILIKHYYAATVLSFREVGRNSPAHEAAYFTHVGKRKANGTISRSQLKAIIQKPTGELLHPEFTGIRSPHRSVKKKYSKKK